MTAKPILPVIDYTSRDYLALRTDLMRLIKARLPEWSGEDPNDFGVAIVEAVSYGLDGLHYYLDRVANEAYLSTATQQESLYALADMFGYTPRGPNAASVLLNFGNSTTNDIEVPDGARFQATIPSSGPGGVVVKTFELSLGHSLIVGANTVSDTNHPGITAPAQEGRTYSNESIAISNGYVFQRYVLPRISVLPETVRVYTVLSGTSVLWSQVQHLSDATGDDLVFELDYQTDGSTVVIFGDGVNGDIPPLHAVIQATYRCGGGASGNVPANSIVTPVYPILPGLTVNNQQAATGGTDTESLASIRANSARAFRMRDRAVTLPDYVSITLAHPQVSKAKGQSNNNASVTVYAVPNDDGSRRPVLTTELRADLVGYLEAKAMAGTTVTVAGPYYVQFYLNTTVYLDPSARRSVVEANVRTALAQMFSFDSLDFDQRLTAYDVQTAFYGIPGIAYATVNSLDTVPASGKVQVIVFADIVPNAFPYYDEATSLTLTLVGGV